jgi:hypothetical protein
MRIWPQSNACLEPLFAATYCGGKVFNGDMEVPIANGDDLIAERAGSVCLDTQRAEISGACQFL